MTALAPVLTDWRRSAACTDADPDLFIGPDFESDRAKTRRETKAKRVCAACPVRSACLAFAARTGTKDGVWGGMTEDERRNFARRNRRIALLEMAS